MFPRSINPMVYDLVDNQFFRFRFLVVFDLFLLFQFGFFYMVFFTGVTLVVIRCSVCSFWVFIGFYKGLLLGFTNWLMFDCSLVGNSVPSSSSTFGRVSSTSSSAVFDAEANVGRDCETFSAERSSLSISTVLFGVSTSLTRNGLSAIGANLCLVWLIGRRNRPAWSTFYFVGVGCLNYFCTLLLLQEVSLLRFPGFFRYYSSIYFWSNWLIVVPSTRTCLLPVVMGVIVPNQMLFP